jgi:hypothetical protein
MGPYFQNQIVDRQKSAVAFWVKSSFRIFGWPNQKFSFCGKGDYEKDAWGKILIFDLRFEI